MVTGVGLDEVVQVSPCPGHPRPCRQGRRGFQGPRCTRAPTTRTARSPPPRRGSPGPAPPACGAAARGPRGDRRPRLRSHAPARARRTELGGPGGETGCVARRATGGGNPQPWAQRTAVVHPRARDSAPHRQLVVGGGRGLRDLFRGLAQSKRAPRSVIGSCPRSGHRGQASSLMAFAAWGSGHQCRSAFPVDRVNACGPQRLSRKPVTKPAALARAMAGPPSPKASGAKVSTTEASTAPPANASG